jgi:hypothetical protein
MPYCPRCGDEFQSWVKECPDCRVSLTAAPQPKQGDNLRLKSKPLDLVTIGIYEYLPEAQENQARLQMAGISGNILDGQEMNPGWTRESSLRRIRLLVEKSQAEEAIQILRDTQTQPKVTSGQICPECGSIDTKYEFVDKRGLWLRLILPLRVNQRKWNCHQCGYSWEKAENYSQKDKK